MLFILFLSAATSQGILAQVSSPDVETRSGVVQTALAAV